MNQNQIYQTAFDQMVNSEQTQMMKALIPYLPSNMQQLMSLYAKTTELSNTVRMFSSNRNMQMCAASVSDNNPVEMLNDVRKYCYGQSQKQLEQLNNLFVMLEMMSVMNQ